MNQRYDKVRIPLISVISAWYHTLKSLNHTNEALNILVSNKSSSWLLGSVHFPIKARQIELTTLFCEQLRTEMFYICANLIQLAVESRYSSRAKVPILQVVLLYRMQL